MADKIQTTLTKYKGGKFNPLNSASELIREPGRKKKTREIVQWTRILREPGRDTD